MKLPAKTYIIVAALLVALMLTIILYCLFANFSRLDKVAYIYIDADDTEDSVYQKIEPIAHATAFNGFATIGRHSGYANHILTGRYAIPPDESTLQVFRRITHGMQEPIMLTIPESRTIPRLAAYLSSHLMIDSLEIAQSLSDSTYVARYGYDLFTLPALFIPNTYEMYWNISLDAFMERMQREHTTFWSTSRLALCDSVGLNPIQVATLASIIDEETANVAEKPTIAGMYLNRLREDMPLQADPTVKFAIGDFTLRRIYKKHLSIDSPYNTYQNTGLPPGPIKIASVKAIDAVLHYDHHNYFYMCAKEDFSGTHNFAESYYEHLRNARKYSQALNRRGIK